jgi:hypothetical protein
VIRRLRIAWLRWCRDTAAEELRLFQARCDVGSAYLANTLIHINTLERRIAALEA